MTVVKINANDSGCGRLKGWRRAAYEFKYTFGEDRINGLPKLKFIVTKFTDKKENQRAELCYVLPGEAPKPVELDILKMVAGDEARTERIVEDLDGRWFYESDEWLSYGGRSAYDTVHTVMYDWGHQLAIALIYKDKLHSKEDVARVYDLIRKVGNYTGETNEGVKGDITLDMESANRNIANYTASIERYTKYIADITSSLNHMKALLDKYGIVKMPTEV